MYRSKDSSYTLQYLVKIINHKRTTVLMTMCACYSGLHGTESTLANSGIPLSCLLALSL